MEEMTQFGRYAVEKVFVMNEVNLVVTEPSGYVCRLVPGYGGFELSAADKALGNDPGHAVVSSINEFILMRDA